MNTPEIDDRNHFECFVCRTRECRTSKYPGSPNPLGFREIETCVSCGLGYAAPRVHQDDINKFYASGLYWGPQSMTGIEVHQLLQARERLKIAASAIRGPPEKVRLLDIGAGHAILGDLAHRTFQCEYHFIEPDDALAQKVLARPTDVGFERVDSLIDAKDFDLIFANQVMEHVENPRSFFTELVSAAAPGGLIYIEVPYRDDEFKADVFPHTMFFSPSALRRLFETDSRADVISIESFGGLAVANPRGTWERLKISLLNRSSSYALRLGLRGLAEFFTKIAVDYSVRPRGLWLRALIRRRCD